MVQKDVIQRMIKFNQSLFNNAFDASVKLQDQAETLSKTMMDKAGWLPGESRKFYDNYLDAYKAGRSNFKSYIDDGYQQTVNLFK